MTRLMRYGIVGVSTNLFFYFLFLLLVWIGFNAVLASGLCYGLAVVASYTLHRRWTFLSLSTHARDLPRYLAAYGGGLGVTLLTVQLSVGTVGPAIAQLLAVVIAAMTIYTGLHVLRFGHAR